MSRHPSPIMNFLSSPFLPPPFLSRIGSFTHEGRVLKSVAKVKHWRGILETTVPSPLYYPSSREASFLETLSAIVWQLIQSMMCASWLRCYATEIKVESWDYVSISALFSLAVLLCSPEKEERLQDKHLSCGCHSAAFQAPGWCLNDTWRVLTQWCLEKQGRRWNIKTIFTDTFAPWERREY